MIHSYSNTMDFFRSQMKKILMQRKLELNESTEFYIVNLLTDLTRLDTETTDFETPLAMIYSEACSAQNMFQRYKHLKKLGDHSLYISGFFGDSIAQKIVDLDYYMEMGRVAYQTLSSLSSKNEFVQVYNEMAIKFQYLVDLLNEMSEEFACTSDEDLLKIYDRWRATKSERLLKRLLKEGFKPVDYQKDTH